MKKLFLISTLLVFFLWCLEQKKVASRLKKVKRPRLQASTTIMNDGVSSSKPVIQC